MIIAQQGPPGQTEIAVIGREQRDDWHARIKSAIELPVKWRSIAHAAARGQLSPADAAEALEACFDCVAAHLVHTAKPNASAITALLHLGVAADEICDGGAER